VVALTKDRQLLTVPFYEWPKERASEWLQRVMHSKTDQIIFKTCYPESDVATLAAMAESGEMQLFLSEELERRELLYGASTKEIPVSISDPGQ
jgi:hypothetical protein